MEIQPFYNQNKFHVLKDLVSIIIPTRNRGELIGRTLDSLRSQTYSNWECIIVDDYSEDYTAELMEFYSEQDFRLKYYKRPTDLSQGANVCRNFGFSLSRGEYVNWFDSDDVMHPYFIAKKLNKLKGSGDLCCISSFSTFEYKQGKLIICNKHLLEKENIFENICLGKHPLPTNGPLWKRSFLENKMLFKEDLSISQDLEFFSRLLPEDNKISVIEEPLFLLRRGHNTITSEFYEKMDQHFNSYFLVRKNIVCRYSENSVIKNYYRNELMGIFRFLLGKKKYCRCREILEFFKENYCTSYKSRLRLVKLRILLLSIQLLGRGETKFKKYLSFR